MGSQENPESLTILRLAFDFVKIKKGDHLRPPF